MMHWPGEFPLNEFLSRVFGIDATRTNAWIVLWPMLLVTVIVAFSISWHRRKNKFPPHNHI